MIRKTVRLWAVVALLAGCASTVDVEPAKGEQDGGAGPTSFEVKELGGGGQGGGEVAPAPCDEGRCPPGTYCALPFANECRPQ